MEIQVRDPRDNGKAHPELMAALEREEQAQRNCRCHICGTPVPPGETCPECQVECLTPSGVHRLTPEQRAMMADEEFRVRPDDMGEHP